MTPSLVLSKVHFLCTNMAGGCGIEQPGVRLILTLRKDTESGGWLLLSPPLPLLTWTPMAQALAFLQSKTLSYTEEKAKSLWAYKAGSDQGFHDARRRMDGLELQCECRKLYIWV